MYRKWKKKLLTKNEIYLCVWHHQARLMHTENCEKKTSLSMKNIHRSRASHRRKSWESMSSEHKFNEGYQRKTKDGWRPLLIYTVCIKYTLRSDAQWNRIISPFHSDLLCIQTHAHIHALTHNTNA